MIPVLVISKYLFAINAADDNVMQAPGASILDLRGIKLQYQYALNISTYNLRYIPNHTLPQQFAV
jgi:hypothetical protein